MLTEKLREITRNYKKLQEITRNYKKLQEITRNYKKLQEITRNYKKLQKITISLISVFHPFANIHLYFVDFETIWFIGIQI
jgi:hypothetical protein